MSEECSFYYYDNGYSCAIKKEKEGNSSIDSDTVHRFCWGYHYEECPRYKSRDTSSGPCFLTSACVEARGLPDDCYELTVLRSFRDGYMRSLSYGDKDIKEYYRCAPPIVASINKQNNKQEIFEKIYLELVLPCVELIENGKNNEAYITYKKYTEQLRDVFLGHSCIKLATESDG